VKRIRKLGLAALAALALTAMVGVSSASASGFVASKYPATIEGGATSNTFISVASSTFSCSGFSEKLGLAEAISGPVDTLYHSGKNGPCTAEGPIASKSTIEPNGCGAILQTGAETAAGKFAATVDIGPYPGASKCGPVRINGSYCDVLIPEQKGIAATLVNQGNGEAADSVVAGVSGAFIKVLLEGCFGWETEQYASFSSSWELRSYNVLSEKIDLHVDQTGAYFGKGGFEAEEYPVAFLGRQDAASPHLFNFSGRTVKCSSIAFNEGHASGSSTSMALEAAYGGCRAAVLNVDLPASIDMNSCGYVLNSAGTLDVACTSEGDGIEVSAYNSESDQKLGIPYCVWKVAPQKGIGSVSYGTAGEGSARAIDADLNLKGLSFARTVGGLVGCGAKASTATYTGGLLLGGAR